MRPLQRSLALAGLIACIGSGHPDAWSGRQGDPPLAMLGETARLRFDAATPAPGRLDRQVRAEVDELTTRDPHGTFLKLRVFAVGPDDLLAARRAIVDLFHSTRRPLPAIALAGVAGFPTAGQRVQIESVSADPEDLNPDGLAFLAGVAGREGDQAVRGLARVAADSGVKPADVLRVSCFYEDAAQMDSARAAIAATFRSARAAFVRSFTPVDAASIECEAVARLSERVPDEGVRYVNPGPTPSPNFSRAALVSAPRLAFTGTAVALGTDGADLRAMFERAKAAVEPIGASLRDVVMADNYWLTPAARDRLREVRPGYFDGTVPAASGVFFSGVESPVGTVAMDLVVASRRVKARD